MISEVEKTFRPEFVELVDAIADLETSYPSITDKQLAQDVYAECSNATLCIRGHEHVEPDDFSRGELIDIAATCLRLARRLNDPTPEGPA